MGEAPAGSTGKAERPANLVGRRKVMRSLLANILVLGSVAETAAAAVSTMGVLESGLALRGTTEVAIFRLGFDRPRGQQTG